jgi:hemolysin activation/secretion protein
MRILLLIFTCLLLAVSPGFTQGRGNLLEIEKIALKEVHIEGAPLLDAKEIATVTGPYLGKEISFETVEEIRHKLTQLLVSKGFINSGVIIPDQEVVAGVIVMRVVAGGLTRVEIEGNSQYSTAWLEKKLRRGTAGAFNIYDLQENLQLLQFDRPVKRIHAELKAGDAPGESVLAAKVEEKFPLGATLNFSNNAPPSTGSYHGDLTLTYTNLLGRGDFIEGTIGRTGGKTDYALRTAIPLNSYDTTVEAYYSEGSSTIIEEDFEDLDIENESRTYGLKLLQPFYLSLNSQLTLALAGERRRSQSYLLDIPFSFSPGVVNGLAVTSVIRASQEYIYRSNVDVFALASSFNFGVDAFHPTIHQDGYADGEYFSWLGQFRYIRQLNGSQVVARLDTQLTNDRLLPMEKFAVGGLNSVRGYRNGYLVRDNGVSGTLEGRIPLYGTVNATGLSFIPFYDFGYARDSSPHAADGEFIHSVGAGFRWSPIPSLAAEVYYGHALKLPDDFEKDDPQDKGLHFALSWTTL